MRRGFRPFLRSFLAHVSCVLILSACAPSPTVEIPSVQPTSTPPQLSLWGEITTVAETAIVGQPQFLSQDAITHIWVNVMENALYAKQGEPPAQKLTFSTNQVRDLRAINSLADSIQLLWLDSHDSGGNRLYAGRLNADWSVQRAEQAISDLPTFHFTALEDAEGVIWVIWSGGQRPETNLYIQTIDSTGRSRFPERIIGDADFPALIHYAAQSLALYWIRPTTRTVYRSPLQQGQIVGNQNLGFQITPKNGQYIANFQPSADRTHDYLIWTLSDGASSESWFSASVRGSDSWSTPQKITITATDEPIETGFNSGSVLKATVNVANIPFTWATTLTGEYDSVPVAGYYENSLAIVYLKNGVIYGVQEIVPLTTPLIDFPLLASDHERHLYLTWSEVDLPSGYTHLKFTATKH